MTTPRTQQLIFRLRTEWPLPVSIATTALFLVFGNRWLADLSDPVWFAFLLGWLFAAIQVSAFAVVRHAEWLAVRLGESFGTLVLTLSMSGMEMMAEHQSDDPGGPHHRLHYGQNDHPRTRCRRYDLAVIDLGGEHAYLRP